MARTVTDMLLRLQGSELHCLVYAACCGVKAEKCSMQAQAGPQANRRAPKLLGGHANGWAEPLSRREGTRTVAALLGNRQPCGRRKQRELLGGDRKDVHPMSNPTLPFLIYKTS